MSELTDEKMHTDRPCNKQCDPHTDFGVAKNNFTFFTTKKGLTKLDGVPHVFPKL